MADVFIVAATRTPIGKRNGSLASVHPVMLAATALREAVRRSGIDPAAVDDVIMGCVSQVNEQGLNIARNAALLAGLPLEVPATTVDRQCGSGQQAVHFGAALIASGAADLIVAGGIESMSRVPLGSSVAGGEPFLPELLERYPMTHQGVAAERIAEQWNISRTEMEALALVSHQRAAAARASGFFEREIVPVALPDGTTFAADEGIRPGSTVEQLAALKPAFLPDGRITAATSSQISDGAAAVVLASEQAVRRFDLTPRARIVAHRVVGSDPVLMLTGPVAATRRVLVDADLTLDDIDLTEINEAFASVVLMWQRELALPDLDRVNVNGGAMALGHPVGASGARLLVTLLHEMERRGVRLGLQTMCCGGGLGTGLVIERV
jgi:acetyl-CoA acyltransferase